MGHLVGGPEEVVAQRFHRMDGTTGCLQILEGGGESLAVPGISTDEQEAESDTLPPEQFGGVQDGPMVLAWFMASHHQHHRHPLDGESASHGLQRLPVKSVMLHGE